MIKLGFFSTGFYREFSVALMDLMNLPLVIYGNIRNWTARHFRTTLQAYFLAAGILAMLGSWYRVLWTWEVTYCFLIFLPVATPTIFLGRYFNHQLEEGNFLKYVYLGLIVIGVLLIGQSLL